MNNEILSLIEENPIPVAKLRPLLASMNAVDVAALFADMDRDKVVSIFRLLPKNMAAEVFAYIEPEEQQ
ncbi:MAG: magnesium transporter, partial [Spirochaetaceae bacterium]|nr:magnesium transporter [Spirochaetaceae bacterium]